MMNFPENVLRIIVDAVTKYPDDIPKAVDEANVGCTRSGGRQDGGKATSQARHRQGVDAGSQRVGYVEVFHDELPVAQLQLGDEK